MAPTPKKNTRGNKNTKIMEKEGPEMNEGRLNKQETFDLTGNSFQVKENYHTSFIKLKSYNDIIRSFLREDGITFNLKKFNLLFAHKGYQAEKTQELTLESLRTIFIKGKVFKTVTVKIPGTFKDGSKNEQVAIDDSDLQGIIKDIANLDLKSFKALLKQVNEETYVYDPAPIAHYPEKIKAADEYQKKITNYALDLKYLTFNAFEAYFFEPELLSLANQLNLTVPQIGQLFGVKISQVIEAFQGRDELRQAIYQSSSAEVIDAIEDGRYKCKNPTDDEEITKANNKVLQEISGESADADAPIRTTGSSDIVFHNEHAMGQCLLQETLQLQKNIHAAQVNTLAERLLIECSEAVIKESIANFDKAMLSNSTDVILFDDRKKRCDQLKVTMIH